jgi:hypothetical protein
VAEPPKGSYELWGEFCREAAVLIFVFGNLDVWLKGFTGDLARLNIGPWSIVRHFVAVLIVTGVFQATGILLEKWRTK